MKVPINATIEKENSELLERFDNKSKELDKALAFYFKVVDELNTTTDDALYLIKKSKDDKR